MATDEKKRSIQAYRRRHAMRDEEEKARALARQLTSFVNGSGAVRGAFLDELRKDHRTLQQSVTGLFVEWFEMLAETEEGRYDMRNEASVKLARKFVERLDEGERALPCI